MKNSTFKKSVSCDFGITEEVRLKGLQAFLFAATEAPGELAQFPQNSQNVIQIKECIRIRGRKAEWKMKDKERAEAIRKVRDQAEQQQIEFFQDPLRHAHATMPAVDHRETWPIRSRDFKLWVMQTLYDAIGAAPAALVKECIDEFETRAICRGPKREIFVRVGWSGGACYIDLGNELWQVVELDSAWRVLDDSPAKFQRASGMLGLPYPAEGQLRELLKFLNLRSRADEILLLTWLTFSLRPKGPFPVLSLSGPTGSAKSTTATILRRLIDPSQAELTTEPRSERDLAIAATNSHLIAIDNLSQVSTQLSDALCRVSTGGSFRTRRLYKNNEEMIFTFKCPIILTGIGELPTRSDLLNRSLLIQLEKLSQYRNDEELLAESEEACPRIFGGLLDVLCAGLRNAKNVEVTALPRMAAFARFGVAVEELLGFKPGDFLAAYRENIQRANDVVLEASPIFVPIRDLLERCRRFSGTAVELLEKLTVGATDLAKKHPHWPKAANQLSAEIARIETDLAKAGIWLERGRNRRGRFIVLELRESQARDNGGNPGSASEFVNAARAS